MVRTLPFYDHWICVYYLTLYLNVLSNLFYYCFNLIRLLRCRENQSSVQRPGVRVWQGGAAHSRFLSRAVLHVLPVQLPRGRYPLISHSPTNKNKQNVTFLFLQGLAEAFLDHLWKLLQAPNQAPILRQAAAGYMGSFMARAKFLPVSYVILCSFILSNAVGFNIWSSFLAVVFYLD